MKIHQKYMSRCLELAKNGLGTTYPNPLVGCVIIHENKIIGEGWHQKAGSPHAEVYAIRSVTDLSLLSQSTLYVNLEPCSHFGKTPPCADLIIEKKLKRVVIGTTDPHEKVAGKGIEKLQAAGVEVISNVLEEECRMLNKRFFTFHQKKRPYIFLKWAETTNGFMAPKHREEKQPVWITNTFSRQWVHRLRAREQAILVGTKTVLEDNPTLTVRDWEGPHPLRVVLDRSLKIPMDASVFGAEAPTLVFSEKSKKGAINVEYGTIDFSVNIAQDVLKKLYERKVQSVIVEGGRETLQTFIDAQLWDEAYIFRGPSTFEEGISAPTLQGKLLAVKHFKEDLLYHFKNSGK